MDDTGAARKWVFRTCFTDAVQGAALAKFASGYIKATKVAILFNSSSEAPKSQAELMKKAIEARSGQIVAFETYAAGEKDLSAQWKKIADAAPDLVFLPSYYSEVPEQIKQARAAGVKAPFLGSDTWGNPELLKNAAEVEGAYFGAHYNPDAMEDKVGIFRAAFEQRYAKEVPDDGAALTYDTMMLLKTALQSATEPRPRSRAGGLLEDHVVRRRHREDRLQGRLARPGQERRAEAVQGREVHLRDQHRPRLRFGAMRLSSAPARACGPSRIDPD